MKKHIDDLKCELELTGKITNHNEAICPHCFEEDGDSVELDFGDGEYGRVTCEKCFKSFNLELNVVFIYTSSLPTEGE